MPFRREPDRAQKAAEYLAAPRKQCRRRLCILDLVERRARVGVSRNSGKRATGKDGRRRFRLAAAVIDELEMHRVEATLVPTAPHRALPTERIDDELQQVALLVKAVLRRV